MTFDDLWSDAMEDWADDDAESLADELTREGLERDVIDDAMALENEAVEKAALELFDADGVADDEEDDFDDDDF